MISYHRPADLAAALAVKARYAHDDRALTVLAGGTDVYPAKTTRAGWGEMTHADVLDITAISSLRGITQSADGWHLGALTTWTDVIRSSLPALFNGLKQASRDVGGVQIQNRGTIVGNVCNASPAADGVPCLLALNAIVEIASTRGTRRMPLAEFITGNRRTVLAPDEIVTGVAIPHAAGSGLFVKLGARKYLVISIAMVAGVLDLSANGVVRSARIAIGSCSAVARRQPALETFLTGRDLAALRPDAITPEMLTGLTPIADSRASAEFRRQAAIDLTRDLLAASSHSLERSAA